MDAYPSIPAGIYDESGDWGIVNARIAYAPADGAWEVCVDRVRTSRMST